MFKTCTKKKYLMPKQANKISFEANGQPSYLNIDHNKFVTEIFNIFVTRKDCFQLCKIKIKVYGPVSEKILTPLYMLQ